MSVPGRLGRIGHRRGATTLRPSAAPGARRPAGGSLPSDNGGGRQGSLGTGVCLLWPSGTRSWATPARWRRPRRPGGRRRQQPTPKGHPKRRRLLVVQVGDLARKGPQAKRHVPPCPRNRLRSPASLLPGPAASIRLSTESEVQPSSCDTTPTRRWCAHSGSDPLLAADDEQRPGSKGQQRSANAQLDSAVLPVAAGQVMARKALFRHRLASLGREPQGG
jgi:hypothetical protein